MVRACPHQLASQQLVATAAMTGALTAILAAVMVATQDMEQLYIAQPQSGEQALEICDTLVRR